MSDDKHRDIPADIPASDETQPVRPGGATLLQWRKLQAMATLQAGAELRAATAAPPAAMSSSWGPSSATRPSTKVTGISSPKRLSSSGSPSMSTSTNAMPSRVICALSRAQ